MPMHVYSLYIQLFERRAKMVKPGEAKNWKQVTPDMMSEEEAEGEEFIRHRPDWRSPSFNIFIEKLEKRYKKKKKSLAKPRSYGNEVSKLPPSDISSWMIKDVSLSADTASVPLSSDSEEENITNELIN